MSRILLCGGDLRMVYLAKIFAQRGYSVGVCGIDEKLLYDSGALIYSGLSLASREAELIILPPLSSDDGVTINTPHFDGTLYLCDIYENASAHTIVCTGKMDVSQFEKRGIYIVNYVQREDFASLNAVPTAEGAIEAVMKQLPVTIFSSNAVVTGFGKCAKVLALTLKGMGARVWVCARSTRDISMAQALGLNGVELGDMCTVLKDAHMVFNTIPHIVFKARELSCIGKDCPLADLASAPGGVDKTALSKADIKYMPLPGLPGKYSPVSAAQIICKTVENIIGECGKDASIWNLREKG